MNIDNTIYKYNEAYRVNCAVMPDDVLSVGTMVHHPGLIAIDSHSNPDDECCCDHSFTMTPETARVLSGYLLRLAGEIDARPAGDGEGEGKK